MKSAIETINSELFTLNSYLKNEDMIMHHERFKNMIQALKTAKQAIKFTQFVLEEFQYKDGIDFEKIFKDLK